MEEINSDSRRPRWPLFSTLILSVLLAAFTTTGGRQVFVKEVLGSAFDSQAEHFLHGDVDVDGDAIRHEAIIVNGRARMYFGPFPALLRIPLNFIYPAGLGYWSRLSGLTAGILALASFAALVAGALRRSSLSLRSRAWFGSACVVGFALGSPLLLLLGNLSIYNEAIIWAFAWALAALFFAVRARKATEHRLIASLFGFSFCAGAALLSRATFGLPVLLIAPLFLLRLPRTRRFSGAAAALGPVGSALIFYIFLSYARFGTWSGTRYENYINPVHREFAREHGMFSLSRIPFGFVDYFTLRFPHIDSSAPFLQGQRHPVPYPLLYSLPFSENYLSVLWCSSWLIVGAIIGLAYLFQRTRSDCFQRWVAAAFFIQFVLILSHFSLAQRYATELYSFLIFCFLIFLARSGPALNRLRHFIVALVGASIAINSLTTVSWLIDADQNVPAETRDVWKSVLGQSAASKKD